MVMQSMAKQYHRDFVHRVRSDRFSPCVTAVPHRRRTSDYVQSFDHEGTHFSFHHCCSLHICRRCSWTHLHSL